MRFSLDQEKKWAVLNLEEKSKIYTQITNDIVESSEDNQLVLSGPGTGKTTIFLEKIKKWQQENINNEDILISSFINNIVEDLSDSLPGDCKVYTLHKIAKIIIHQYLGKQNNFLFPLTNEFTITWDCDKSNIFEDLTTIENLLDSPDSIQRLFETYFQTLDNSKKPTNIETYMKLTSFYDSVTFEDSIVRALKACLLDSTLFKFKKIIVDEYQDFNPTEQHLVLALFERSSGGIVAADDDQSIYASRKARPSGLQKLIDDKSWEKRTIPFCGRTKSEYVVESAIQICRKQTNPNRQDKTFLPLNMNGKKIQVITLKSSVSSPNPNRHFIAEGEYIASKIDKEKVLQWTAKHPAYLVLGKTAAHLEKVAKTIGEKLDIQVGIKEKSIYDDPDVQILFSYIQLLNNIKSNIAYRRLIGLNSESDKKKIFTQAWLKGGFNNLNEPIIKDIIKNVKIIEELTDKGSSTKDLLWKIAETLNLDQGNSSLADYINSVQSISFERIIGETENLVIAEKEKQRRALLSYPVQCMTIWGSKGLKADTVFLLGLEEGYLPKLNSAVEDEEIRLMYVAMTRAVETLYLLSCSRRYDGVHSLLGGTEGPTKQSIFLGWLENTHVERSVLGKEDF